jgi:hypothetical protein
MLFTKVNLQNTEFRIITLDIRDLKLYRKVRSIWSLKMKLKTRKIVLTQFPSVVIHTRVKCKRLYTDFSLVNKFIDHLQVVSTNNYNILTGLHTKDFCNYSIQNKIFDVCFR